MNHIELEDRIETLVKFLKRQGGQHIVPSPRHWRSFKICELVEAVEMLRKRINKDIGRG